MNFVENSDMAAFDTLSTSFKYIQFIIILNELYFKLKKKLKLYIDIH